MGRLPKGIIRKKNGLYVGRFQHKGVRREVTSKSLKECKEKLEKMKYEIKSGIYCEETKVTVDKWFNVWIEEYKEQTVKRTTIEVYKTVYKEHIKQELGHRRMKDIRPEHVQRLYNTLKKDGKGRKTIELVRTVLSGMFGQAYKNSMLKKNPVMLATLPRMEKQKEPRVMTLEEQRLFIQYAREENEEIADICEILLATGLRCGELRALEWENVDFEKQELYITGTLNYSKETGFRKDDTKTETSKRVIPMLDNVVMLLKRIKRKRMETQLSAGGSWKPEKGLENLIFLRENGKPLHKDYIKKRLDTIQKRIKEDGCEFERITPHTLRHTFATRCIENGVPPQVLKSLLGHSKLALTMDLYAHVLPDTKEKEIKKIAGLF